MPTGLLFNGTELRLVYAPRGESSGYVTFRVKEMAEVAGRPIFAGLHMLLEAPRLFSMAGEAAASGDSGRQPQVPERRQHAVGRAGVGSAVRVAARVPGGRRPAARGAVARGAGR